MFKSLGRVGALLVTGLLFVGLVGVLGVFLVVVTDLPAQVYSPTQRSYLESMEQRRASQEAPTLNTVGVGDATGAEGEVLPGLIVPWEDSRVLATLDARYEEHEGVGVTLYDLEFLGQYRVSHSGASTITVELAFAFPPNLETLHAVSLLIDGQEPDDASYSTSGIRWWTDLTPGAEHEVAVSYKADGASSFTYALQQNQRTNVEATAVVSGMVGTEVPDEALPPTADETSDGGQVLTWDYTGLIADRDIKITLPARLSFAQRVAALQDDFRALAGLAPFLVALFLASLAGVLNLSGMRLKIEGYLLAGCGVALFYPLLTFLSGLTGVDIAAPIALVVVAGLLQVFPGLAVGWRRVWFRLAWLALIFLGFFSLGTIMPWRGLAFTCGALLLVGTFMLLYARRPRASEPEPVAAATAPREMGGAGDSVSAAEGATEEAPARKSEAPAKEPEPEERLLHCTFCGAGLGEGFRFCAKCGESTSALGECPSCGREQIVAVREGPVYCLSCGSRVRE